MKEMINYNKLSNEDKKEFLDLAVSCELQVYVKMYDKLKRAGITDLEILKLRGLPDGYKDVENKLCSGKIFFEKNGDNYNVIHIREK